MASSQLQWTFDPYQVRQFNGMTGAGMNYVPPPLISPQMMAISEGTGLVGSVINSMFGNKQYNRDRKGLLSMLGKNVLNPYQITATTDRVNAQKAKSYGNYIDNKYDLDAGKATGALYQGMIGQRYKTLADLILQNDMAKSSRDLAIRQSLLNASASRG